MNITIRRMRPDDVDALYRLLSDPAVMRYLEPPYDRAQFCTRRDWRSRRSCMPPRRTALFSAM